MRANRVLLSGLLPWVIAGCVSAPPARPAPASALLSCLLPTNCVSSLDGERDFAPLPAAGDPEATRRRLLATIRSFAATEIAIDEPLFVEAVFTTPAGFRDTVRFVIDPASGRVDYASRSGFGLYDFGKNRSRMREFVQAYARRAAAP